MSEPISSLAVNEEAVCFLKALLCQEYRDWHRVLYEDGRTSEEVFRQQAEKNLGILESLLAQVGSSGTEAIDDTQETARGGGA